MKGYGSWRMDGAVGEVIEEERWMMAHGWEGGGGGGWARELWERSRWALHADSVCSAGYTACDQRVIRFALYPGHVRTLSSLCSRHWWVRRKRFNGSACNTRPSRTLAHNKKTEIFRDKHLSVLNR